MGAPICNTVLQIGAPHVPPSGGGDGSSTMSFGMSSSSTVFGGDSLLLYSRGGAVYSALGLLFLSRKKEEKKTERGRSARNRKIVVDAKWETGETWLERGRNVEKKGLVQ